MLSLSQILNQNKVTPVPSPFAPSPSPTNNVQSNNYNNSTPSIQNVYALQSLLNTNNHTNHSNYNKASTVTAPQPFATLPAAVADNPFGPTSDPSHVLCVDTGRSSETAKAHRG
eukprot:TRINITY_DN1637_c0_g1_i1.p1 TRINITY_DN1637_c0_g1~~TRINITY_DN1637_c0_g1_i1.p1  ORF type:complete len:114 (-),score=36.25 TRINITY_DN1637_c0_g1_i1:3-344(-)